MPTPWRTKQIEVVFVAYALLVNRGQTGFNRGLFKVSWSEYGCETCFPKVYLYFFYFLWPTHNLTEKAAGGGCYRLR